MYLKFCCLLNDSLNNLTPQHVQGTLHTVDYDKLAADYFELRPHQQRLQQLTQQGIVSISSATSGLGSAIKERVLQYKLAAFLEEHLAGE